MIKYINVVKAKELLDSKENCILNIVASWCSDCTKQSKNLPLFAKSFNEIDCPVYELNVQDEKNIYLSQLEKVLTEKLGGHGFPRTILIVEGKAIDTDNVEVITQEQLEELCEQFKKQLNAKL